MEEYDPQEIIRSFLEGRPPGYRLVETWANQVVRARAWGQVPREDVKQEIFGALIKCFRAREFRGDGELEAYVKRIAFRVCAAAVRRLERERKRRHILTERPPREPQRNPEDDRNEKERLRVFREVWMKLSERCRNLLFDKIILRKEYRDIAPALGITERYCKKLKFECLQRAQNIARGKK